MPSVLAKDPDKRGRVPVIQDFRKMMYCVLRLMSQMTSKNTLLLKRHDGAICGRRSGEPKASTRGFPLKDLQCLYVCLARPANQWKAVAQGSDEK